DKSELFWPRLSNNPGAGNDLFPKPILHRTGGLCILGAPVGTKRFCQQHASDLTKVKCLWRKLVKLEDPHTAYSILLRCASYSNIVFLTRTCPSRHILQALQQFDKGLVAA